MILKIITCLHLDQTSNSSSENNTVGKYKTREGEGKRVSVSNAGVEWDGGLQRGQVHFLSSPSPRHLRVRDI